MSHPCDGHACDHCYLCDVVGICCATVSTGANASPSVSDAHDAALRNAVVDARDSVSSLSVLVRIEAVSALPPPATERAALQPPPADVLVDVIYGDDREECREPAARPQK